MPLTYLISSLIHFRAVYGELLKLTVLSIKKCSTTVCHVVSGDIDVKLEKFMSRVGTPLALFFISADLVNCTMFVLFVDLIILKKTSELYEGQVCAT